VTATRESLHPNSRYNLNRHVILNRLMPVFAVALSLWEQIRKTSTVSMQDAGPIPADITIRYGTPIEPRN
jgi:hypothetical protein